MSPFRVLVTCPPMIGQLSRFLPSASNMNLELIPAQVTQTLSEHELMGLLPKFDGWIIGDDPATRQVFESARRGTLKAAVKWGIGVDNVDFEACSELNIPIANTPGMFGAEVADVAVGYVIALARHTFEIDRNIRTGSWPKLCGISLAGRTAAVLGYGDIGKNTVRRLQASDMNVIVYDPRLQEGTIGPYISAAIWPDRISEADFIVVNCALTQSSRYMLNSETFSLMKKGVRIVNVARGPIINEEHLIHALSTGKVYSAALDVFENEPLPSDSALLLHPRCILGSHNASNTVDSVERTSHEALRILSGFLSGD
jgi:D-3-phosphoglycerate dehydrogenase